MALLRADGTIAGVWVFRPENTEDEVVGAVGDAVKLLRAYGSLECAMEKVGLFNENGPCLTRGGNGEDTSYFNRMKEAGYLAGVTGEDVATHIDGY